MSSAPLCQTLCERLWSAEPPPEALRQAAILHIAALRAVAQEDAGIGGVRIAALCSALRGRAPGATLGALLRATAIGIEVGGRVGLRDRAAGPDRAGPDRAATEAAEAAGLAALEGRGAAEAAEAVDRAAGGQALSGGWLAGGPEAREQRWLIGGALVGADPVSPGLRVVAEAVAEILARHVRAAEKRLRADQVERIEVRGPAGLAGVPVGLPEGELTAAGVLGSAGGTIGLLVARHRVAAEDLAPAALAERAADIRHVAGVLEIAHAPLFSAQAAGAAAGALGALYGSRRAAAGRFWRAGIGGPEQWAELVWKGGAAGLIAAAAASGAPSPERYRWSCPISVRLYTTRGGWWPERRALPEVCAGSGGDADPGARWARMEALALARYPEDRRAAVAGLIPFSGPGADRGALGADASEWLEGLWF